MRVSLDGLGEDAEQDDAGTIGFLPSPWQANDFFHLHQASKGEQSHVGSEADESHYNVAKKLTMTTQKTTGQRRKCVCVRVCV